MVNTIAGAMALQEVFEHAEWLSNRASPAGFARHLRTAPLPGVTARPLILQFSRGDQQVVNPANAAPIRAGNLVDRTTLYRHDLFSGRASFKNPHTFAVVTGTTVMKDIALEAQAQTATFFETDGQQTIDPDGDGVLFEVPMALPLAELESNMKFVP